MKWPVFMVVAFVFLALDASLTHAMRISDVTPELVTILAVFLALFATPPAVMWSAWLLGLSVDMMNDLPHTVDTAGPILGPNAIGFTVAAFLLLRVRTMLLRRQILTVAIATIVFATVSEVTVLVILLAHRAYEDLHLGIDRTLGGEIFIRGLGAAYTGGIALFLAPLLFATIPAWGFGRSR